MSQLKQMNSQLEKAKSVKEVFTLDFVSDRTIKNYTAATGRKDGANWFQKEVMAMMEIFAEKPALAKADKMSIWGCLMKAAREGLSIADKDIDLIPYGNILKAEPNYKGLRKQMRRMPEMAFVNEAQVVFNDDEFIHDKLLNKIVKHESKGVPKTVTLDNIKAAYVRLEFTDKHVADVVMYHSALVNAYNKSPNKSANGPWATSTEEMCKKCVIKRANKVHFNSIENEIPDDEFKKFEISDDAVETTHEEVKEEVPAATSAPIEDAKVVSTTKPDDF